ncbi:hypothetical protein [Tenacibaculum finnmarkense]|uniref:hypothetical protein n=1 Tax=Tenacibaculum finnmarkense TaxID=2781243 RepID=UPI00187B85F1|nr:hypothetical protein [Tenacibaculum finnmarkense]MBE7635088.1 hypothetical protein [Tenacibaculum finnmarkense genomovar ulcerans]MCD8401472.1 hypothetical protein [Tenacibaculum finnmarkense genomovar ulcerans]MCD8403854.1 hypothetical protein [Tenacibaculum finnmarkense genomovar finnmarkense]MCD8418642.1 hypothetical protein [Tenacibaculum finnmarkense genomovar finnmarkense]MCD8431022.1 hypothetical protein [Tenacibaculum finnmarkense genomovar ulcerans]
MAIIKQAKNITITVAKDYQLFVGEKLEKIAEQINIETKTANLSLISGKKIVAKGNK